MPNDLIERKNSLLFAWMDHTGRGWLTREDYEHMSDRLAALGRPEERRNQAAVREDFMRWWPMLQEAGAVDAEGRVGRAEFLACMRANVAEPKPFIEGVVLPLADRLLKTLDTDRSGMLSYEEYVRLYEGLNVPSDTSGPAFHRLDRDGDGAISHAEWCTAIEEFFLSGDPEAPGNWLLGPPQPPG
ncbi:hypothetical protein AB0I81_24180 [Nonomuraea sp. NPDC050404]|uniref:EF-hand domain-containing protein n=1 Tax=Nonomuraea sp. NPDC050404 TaxID=3155783 RepID=UPI0033CF45CB